MKILAVDTSSKVCSVAIIENKDVLIELHNDDEKTHSVKLMPMIDKAFSTTSLTLDDIDLLACCVGPGSFTGIRIGIATIKAFADAKSIPVVGVNSLESLAFNVACNFDIESDIVCPLLDARNHNVYAGCFNVTTDDVKSISELMADNIDNVISNINKLVKENLTQKLIFIGDGSILYKDLLQDSFENIDVNFVSEEYSKANSISIARIALNKYTNGEYGNSSTLSPMYLRKSQAERALEEK